MLLSDLSQFISDLSVELFALHAHKVIQRVQDATLDGDGSGGADVVSSHHADCDPGSLAHPDGLWHLRKIEYKKLLLKMLVHVKSLCRILCQ